MSKLLQLSFLIALFFCFSFPPVLIAQQLRMQNGSITACGGEFTDSGGTGPLFTNYGNNEDFTLTICPDEPGRRISFFFDTFRLNDDDVLCFYDGESTNSTLLACWDDKLSQGGLFVGGGFNKTIQATLENQSGCLTITFQSNRRGNAFGWSANISCEFACQDVNAAITASDPAVVPADTGWINVCLGEPVSLSGAGNYPQSGQPNTYTQTDAESVFNWKMGDDGNAVVGQDIEYTYSQPGGYIIELEIQDVLGCKNNNAITQRVRVAAPPKFIYQPQDNLCIGDTVSFTTSIDMTVDSTKTISVVPDTGSFKAINIRADSIALPDGEGVFYESQIRFNVFGPSQTVTSETDIRNIFVNMEHSWMRDLEIELECPNGQIMTLHNFDGQRGREVYLGVPNDNDNNRINIGTGFTYNWNLNGTDTWIDFANNNFTTTRATLPGQDYRPFDDFTELIGCPLNGNWTMRIKDLWLFDNGFIFFWGLELDDRLIPSAPETFEPEIESFGWSASNPIFDNADSTVFVVEQDGSLPFTFSTTDEFGCSKDTTVLLNVLSENDPACIKCETRFLDLPDNLIACGGSGIDLEIRANPELDFYNSFIYSWTPTDGLSCSDCPNPTANPSNPTTYIVNATSTALNCTYSDTVLVEVINTPPPSIEVLEINSPICEGDSLGSISLTVTGGQGLRYSWSHDPTLNSPIATDLPPGGYTLIVSDDNGCSTDASFVINQPANRPTVTFEVTPIVCQGDSSGIIRAIPDGGQEPYTYLWSTGDSTQQIENIPPGNYTVTITDANGCTNEPLDNSVTLDDSAIPSPEASINVISTVLCQGSSTGIIEVAVNGGQAPFSIAWNDNSQSARLEDIPAGDYQVSVTDANGCTAVANITLEDPNDDLVQLATLQPVSCAGGNDGSIRANPIGGTGPYTFNWSNGSTNELISGLESGLYILTLTDVNGCTEIDSISLDDPLSITSGAAITNTIDCFGDNSGSIQLNPTGSTSAFQVQWNNGQTGTVVNNLSPGIYEFTITDSNGCTLDSSVIIEEPMPLSISFDITNPSCFDRTDGSISISPSGGTPPYVISSDQGNVVNNLVNGVGIGSQIITVRDANGCFESLNVDVNEPEEFTVTADATPPVVDLGESVQLTATPANGTGAITFAWNAFDNTTIECDDCPTATLLGLRSGTYEVIATDANGCQATDLVDIDVDIDRTILVPTGFTPDGVGAMANDQLHVHGKPGSIINSFQIYNRWGELLYEVEDFEVNDLNVGWDGTFRGEPAPAGVYIWRVSATFIDGYQKTYEGQTNLIR